MNKDSKIFGVLRATETVCMVKDNTLRILKPSNVFITKNSDIYINVKPEVKDFLTVYSDFLGDIGISDNVVFKDIDIRQADFSFKRKNKGAETITLNLINTDVIVFDMLLSSEKEQPKIIANVENCQIIANIFLVAEQIELFLKSVSGDMLGNEAYGKVCFLTKKLSVQSVNTKDIVLQDFLSHLMAEERSLDKLIKGAQQQVLYFKNKKTTIQNTIQKLQRELYAKK